MEHSDEKQGGSVGQGKSHLLDALRAGNFRPAKKTSDEPFEDEAKPIAKEMLQAIQERSVERDRRAVFAFFQENLNVILDDEQITKLVDFCKGKRVRVGDLILPSIGSIVQSDNPKSGGWMGMDLSSSGQDESKSLAVRYIDGKAMIEEGHWEEEKTFINPDTDPKIHKRK